MRSSITFGHVGGIPLKVHWNWLLTAVLVTWSLAAGYFPQEYPGWGRTLYWLVSLGTALLFFASVLLHELGHAWVATREGVPVQSITLFVFGGVAHIAREPETPGSEFRIVIAGPLTSLLLAALFQAVAMLTVSHISISGPAVYLSQINIILAVFNLIPGFPLDGGRILRSILWKGADNFFLATRWATNVGFGIAALFILAGLGFMWFGNTVGGLWIVFIGGYLGLVAHGARVQALEEESGELFVPEVPVLPPAAPRSIEVMNGPEQWKTVPLSGRMLATVPVKESQTPNLIPNK